MICPSCQREVSVSEQNYGALYTCDHCQAVYFINFEGQPEYGEVPAEMPEGFALDSAAPAAPAEEAPADFSQDPFAGSLEPLVDSVNVVSVDAAPLEAGIADEFLIAPVPETAEAAGFSIAADADFNAGAGTESAPESFSAAGEAMPEPAVGEFAVPESFSSEPAPAFGPTPSAAGPADFAGVARELSDFGNTDVQLAGLNYDLRISGLDTQETVRLFREAVEDSRFGWDSAELLKTVRHGRVELLKLSPVKAYILAKRLQFLDIEKEWKQNALS